MKLPTESFNDYRLRVARRTRLERAIENTDLSKNTKRIYSDASLMFIGTIKESSRLWEWIWSEHDAPLSEGDRCALGLALDNWVASLDPSLAEATRSLYARAVRMATYFVERPHARVVEHEVQPMAMTIEEPAPIAKQEPPREEPPIEATPLRYLEDENTKLAKKGVPSPRKLIRGWDETTAVMLTIEEVTEHRRVACRYYDSCLSLAIDSGWPSFGCTRCRGFERRADDEARDREALGRLREMVFG